MDVRTITSLSALSRSKRRYGIDSRVAPTFGAHNNESSTAGRDEDGAVLVLALIFLITVGLIVTALLSWVGNGLTDTGSFQTSRDVEFGATSAVNLAVQNTRYVFDYGQTESPATPFLNNPSPELCANYAVPGQSTSVDVYCTMVWQPYSSNTRVFTYSACVSNTTVDNNPSDCAAKPLLQARYAFYDYASAQATIGTPTQCQPPANNGACGENLTVLSWLWNPVVPAVTALSPATGPITGGTTVTIQGTGFTGGESVNFVAQNPSTGSYNAQMPANIVANPAPGCALPTCLQVTSPVVTSGTAYFVTVTTPGGTSPTAVNDFNSFLPTFTYTAVRPAVNNLVGATPGTITGGDTVTIQGTGFWSAPNNPNYPTQVSFCPDLTGNGCIPGAVLSVTPPPAGSQTETMTALTPSVGAAGNYYIQVQSYGLYSLLTNATPQYTYQVHVPLVVSLSASSGATGSSLTITGANFLAGSSVVFCPTGSYNLTSYTCNQGSAIAATVVPPVIATQITISVPAAAAGAYYPIVTLPGSSGVNTPSQAYNQPADTLNHT